MFWIESSGISAEKLEIIKFYLYSGDIRMLHFLGILMILDIITGIMKAWYNHNLWSRKSLFGYTRKLLVFCIIILANIIDQVLQLQGALVVATMIFYVGNEGLSILENCAQMGVLVPKPIAEKLAVILDDKKERNIVTEIKEEFSVKNSKELPKQEVVVKVQTDNNPDAKDDVKVQVIPKKIYRNPEE